MFGFLLKIFVPRVKANGPSIGPRILRAIKLIIPCLAIPPKVLLFVLVPCPVYPPPVKVSIKFKFFPLGFNNLSAPLETKLPVIKGIKLSIAIIFFRPVVYLIETCQVSNPD